MWLSLASTARAFFGFCNTGYPLDWMLVNFTTPPHPLTGIITLRLKCLDQNSTQRRRSILKTVPLDPLYEALYIRPLCFLQIISMTKNVQNSVACVCVCVCVPWSASKVPQEGFAASLAAGNRQGTGHEVGWTNESSTQAVLWWNNLTAVFHSYSAQLVQCNLFCSPCGLGNPTTDAKIRKYCSWTQ